MGAASCQHQASYGLAPRPLQGDGHAVAVGDQQRGADAAALQQPPEVAAVAADRVARVSTRLAMACQVVREAFPAPRQAVFDLGAPVEAVSKCPVQKHHGRCAAMPMAHLQPHATA